jgi:hypothetical protein
VKKEKKKEGLSFWPTGMNWSGRAANPDVHRFLFPDSELVWLDGLERLDMRLCAAPIGQHVPRLEALLGLLVQKDVGLVAGLAELEERARDTRVFDFWDDLMEDIVTLRDSPGWELVSKEEEKELLRMELLRPSFGPLTERDLEQIRAARAVPSVVIEQVPMVQKPIKCRSACGVAWERLAARFHVRRLLADFVARMDTAMGNALVFASLIRAVRISCSWRLAHRAFDLAQYATNTARVEVASLCTKARISCKEARMLLRSVVAAVLEARAKCASVRVLPPVVPGSCLTSDDLVTDTRWLERALEQEEEHRARLVRAGECCFLQQSLLRDFAELESRTTTVLQELTSLCASGLFSDESLCNRLLGVVRAALDGSEAHRRQRRLVTSTPGACWTVDDVNEDVAWLQTALEREKDRRAQVLAVGNKFVEEQCRMWNDEARPVLLVAHTQWSELERRSDNLWLDVGRLPGAELREADRISGLLREHVKARPVILENNTSGSWRERLSQACEMSTTKMRLWLERGASLQEELGNCLLEARENAVLALRNVIAEKEATRSRIVELLLAAGEGKHPIVEQSMQDDVVDGDEIEILLHRASSLDLHLRHLGEIATSDGMRRWTKSKIAELKAAADSESERIASLAGDQSREMDVVRSVFSEYPDAAEVLSGSPALKCPEMSEELRKDIMFESRRLLGMSKFLASACPVDPAQWSAPEQPQGPATIDSVAVYYFGLVQYGKVALVEREKLVEQVRLCGEHARVAVEVKAKLAAIVMCLEKLEASLHDKVVLLDTHSAEQYHRLSDCVRETESLAATLACVNKELGYPKHSEVPKRPSRRADSALPGTQEPLIARLQILVASLAALADEQERVDADLSQWNAVRHALHAEMATATETLMERVQSLLSSFKTKRDAFVKIVEEHRKAAEANRSWIEFLRFRTDDKVVTLTEQLLHEQLAKLQLELQHDEPFFECGALDLSPNRLVWTHKRLVMAHEDIDCRLKRFEVAHLQECDANRQLLGVARKCADEIVHASTKWCEQQRVLIAEDCKRNDHLLHLLAERGSVISTTIAAVVAVRIRQNEVPLSHRGLLQIFQQHALIKGALSMVVTEKAVVEKLSAVRGNEARCKIAAKREKLLLHLLAPELASAEMSPELAAELADILREQNGVQPAQVAQVEQVEQVARVVQVEDPAQRVVPQAVRQAQEEQLRQEPPVQQSVQEEVQQVQVEQLPREPQLEAQQALEVHEERLPQVQGQETQMQQDAGQAEEVQMPLLQQQETRIQGVRVAERYERGPEDEPAGLHATADGGSAHQSPVAIEAASVARAQEPAREPQRWTFQAWTGALSGTLKKGSAAVKETAEKLVKKADEYLDAK